MSNQTYTREYLLSLPTQARKQYMLQIVEQYVQNIVAAARSGKTSLMISLADNSNKAIAHYIAHPWQVYPTVEEIRETLLEKFPECKITYEEKWVETAPGKKELKKGLEVDWS
jgi:hypothetical protein